MESLINLRRCTPKPIRMANGAVVSAIYKGDLRLRLPVAGQEGQFVLVTIRGVYYHEDFDANLLSWGIMRKHGWEMHSGKAGTYLITPGGKRVDASTQAELTILEHAETTKGAQQPSRAFAVLGGVVCLKGKELLHLHRRLGHVSWTRLVEMCKAGVTIGIGDIRGMPAPELEKAERAIKLCPACAQAKAHRKAIGKRGLDRGTRAGEVMNFDTFYSITRDAATGKKLVQYCLVGVDAYTEWKVAHVESERKALPQAAIDMIEHVHTLTGRYPRLVITDLGSEFRNKTLGEYCRKRGIQWLPSPAGTKELNGRSEKNVDTTKNHTRAMLIGAGMDPKFGWARAAMHHIYVWNRTHVGQRTGQTPYQAMTGRGASALNLGEFGCDAYVHQPRAMRDTTFGSKAEPAIYLGHSPRQNCPIVLLVRSGKTILSKDVTFREGSFKHLRAVQAGRPEDVEAVNLSEVYAEEDDLVDSDPWPVDELEEQQRARAEATEGESEDEALELELEEEEEPRYTLRCITDSRIDSGVKQYRCKWAGYGAQTWEPASNIAEDAPEAVRAYEQFVANRVHARATRSQTRSLAEQMKELALSESLEAVSESSSSSSSGSEVESDGDVDSAESDNESVSEVKMAAVYAARCL